MKTEQPKTINQETVDKLVRRFRKGTGLAMDDPIVVNLVRDCKRFLGYRAYVNRRRSELSENQPGLFASENGPQDVAALHGEEKP